ncbi:MAG: hypothetical protein OEM62_02195 [Acidobacteriota bacterium]|nr:hypothetical protein [Acidobacteriota bacterium]
MQPKRCFLVLLLLIPVWLVSACGQDATSTPDASPAVFESKRLLAEQILADQGLRDVLAKAKDLLATGFTAGEGYEEVWIRDFATFIEISCQVREHDEIRDKLLMFFRFQGDDGNIVDGFMPAADEGAGYDFIVKDSVPGFKAHKNTVATDQESSLVQAVARFVRTTSDTTILDEVIDGRTVRRRMSRALEYLLDHRWSDEHGLLWGGTTVDWGDVRPDHEWGVVLDKSSHRAIDVYDNAMFLIAIADYISLPGHDPETRADWAEVHTTVSETVRARLWDPDRQQFVAHLYLDDSPFPDDVDESGIYYHGGTMTAIAAGLLTPDEIAASLARMVENVRLSGAPSIGLTVYPPYPEGVFKNPILTVPYTYQNGGDWTWFGGRMIQQLVAHGMVEEAYREIRPMVDRVLANDGFWEWYTKDNEPAGWGTFRGSAGALGRAIEMLFEWAEKTVR